MTAILFLLALFSEYTPIDGFADLDAVAAPTDFGFLVIESADAQANDTMKQLVSENLEVMDLPDSCVVRLYFISPNSSGYEEVARLAGEFGGFPAVVVLVGHCGFIELDTEYLLSEMEDAWYRWGTGGSQGICNHCRRCHP